MALNLPKILIVDDRIENIQAFEAILKRLEVSIIMATSAAQALKLAVDHDFCLALVDIQMPEMNGYELVELLRSNNKTKNLAVIFVSAVYTDDHDHYKGYGIGAVDFLKKPINPDFLLNKVKVFVDFYNQQHKLKYLVEELNGTNEALLHFTIRSDAHSLVAQQITSILELDELLDEIVKLIQTKFGYYFVSVWLTNKEDDALILQVGLAANSKTPLKKGTAIPFKDKCIITTVHQTGEHYLTNNAKVDVNYKVVKELPDTQSELTLPLKIGSKIMGVLDIQSNKQDAFDADEKIALQTLANQIAIAIRNAQLYQLEQKRRQTLTKLNQDKDKFFSIVAHDLKGPFSPLLTTLHKLAQKTEILSLQQIKEMSENAYFSAQNAYNLLEDLLQWARIERGQMKCQPGQLELNQIIQQNVNLLNKLALDKGVRLKNSLGQPVFIYADEYMLNTIIRNLITNAIKFTPSEGQITILARLSGKFIEIAVVDTGIGISKENIAKLFHIATHYTTLGTNQEKGTGLGLVTCKEMAELNGGQLWIESTLGKGTSVKFTMPLDKTKPIPKFLTSEQQPYITEGQSTEMSTPSTSPLEKLIPPPTTDLKILFDLAHQGNMKAIIKHSTQIEQLGEQYKPFLLQIQKLAKGFEDEKIIHLLQPLVDSQ